MGASRRSATSAGDSERRFPGTSRLHRVLVRIGLSARPASTQARPLPAVVGRPSAIKRQIVPPIASGARPCTCGAAGAGCAAGRCGQVGCGAGCEVAQKANVPMLARSLHFDGMKSSCQSLTSSRYLPPLVPIATSTLSACLEATCCVHASDLRRAVCMLRCPPRSRPLWAAESRVWAAESREKLRARCARAWLQVVGIGAVVASGVRLYAAKPIFDEVRGLPLSVCRRSPSRSRCIVL